MFALIGCFLDDINVEATGRNIVALTFCAVYSVFHEEVHEVYSDHKQFFCLNDICVVVDFFVYREITDIR